MITEKRPLATKIAGRELIIITSAFTLMTYI